MSRIPCDSRCEVFSNFPKNKTGKIKCMTYEFSITKYQNSIFSSSAHVYTPIFFNELGGY